MIIALDVSSLIYGTGVSVYTKNLVHNLLDSDRDNKYVLFGGSLRRLKELRSILSSFRFTAVGGYVEKTYPIPPYLADIIWNKWHIYPIEHLVGKIDVFHSSDWTQPPTKSFKVTTVHDLGPLLFPKLTNPKIVSVHQQRLKWVLNEVDRVIVPSVTTSNDLAKLGYDKKRIRVIREAVDPSIEPVGDVKIEAVKNKYYIKGKYLLSVGVNKRKNTARIIEAYGKLKPDFDLSLVIIGYSQEKLPHVSGVIFTGHVPQSDMPALFSGSEALVYPSLYEGFGLPILEAYACKVPVVTSNLGSMKEIGQGSILVNPNETESIKQGILDAIQKKEKLIKAGQVILAKHNWFNVAQDTLKVYEESAG